MRARRVLAGWAVTVAAVSLGHCRSSAPPAPDDPPAVSPAWQEVTLPAPPGPPGRLVLRDVAACADRWYAVGAVADASGATTRPAAWTSQDGVTWTSLPIAARSYYGRQHVLYAVACDGSVAGVLGAKRGGAHANPRTSSWRQVPDGTLREVTAPFELYGGPRAVNVARMASGARGWLITGNRTSGAASWVSPDAARFTIVEGAPELRSDDRGETWGFDAVDVDGRWLMVGGIVPRGRTDRDPLAWTSADGVRWQRLAVPGSVAYDELQRVVVVDGVPLAVGLRGRAFGAWRGGDGGWQAAGGFGVARADGIPAVRGATVTAGVLWVATADGAGHSIWMSTDTGASWRSVTGPAPIPVGAQQSVALAGTADRLVVVVDDGERSRAFWALPPNR